MPKATLSFPTATYFNGEFTLSFWMTLHSYQDNANLFFFSTYEGEGSYTNQVRMQMKSTTGRLGAFVDSSEIFIGNLITLKKWHFVTFVLKGTTGYIYLNGFQIQTGTLSVPANGERNFNYIGVFDNKPDVIMDEIKIYSGAMESQQVMNEYELSKKVPSIYN